jgi:hypothetical protein
MVQAAFQDCHNPSMVDELKRTLDRLPGSRVGLRDHALLGFAGAFRRFAPLSEFVPIKRT